MRLLFGSLLFVDEDISAYFLMWAFIVLCFRNQLHSGALMIVIEKSGLLKFTALSAKLTSQERAKQTKRGRLCVGSAS